MRRFHLAVFLAVFCCPGLNAPSILADKPKTILSDDFLTMPGDDLPALKEYVARLFSYEPQSMEEYEKWVRVRETYYSSLLEASDKLLKIATEPTDVALGQKGKLIVFENRTLQNIFDDDLHLKAFVDTLIREAPDSENAIYAQAVLLDRQCRELNLRRHQTMTLEEIKTKEGFLHELKEINDAWLVLEKTMQDFVEKHPGVKTGEILSSVAVGMCYYEMETDQEKLDAFKNYLEQSDLEEAKELLQRFDFLVQNMVTVKACTKLNGLYLLAGDDEQAKDEVRKEFRQWLDIQKSSLDNQTARSFYVRALENALELFGGEAWILDHFHDLKDFYLASDDPAFHRSAGVFDGIIRRSALKGNAMEFEALQLDGTKIDIRDFRGQVVLLDYWATWCGPCIASFPKVEECYEKYRDQGFAVIAYSIDTDLEALRNYEERHSHPWISTSEQLTLDKGGKNYADYYGITSIPHYILIGRDGNVISPATHPAGDEFIAMLEKALQEK
jgi:thiol-disulfide isomerase/thioredoxin